MSKLGSCIPCWKDVLPKPRDNAMNDCTIIIFQISLIWTKYTSSSLLTVQIWWPQFFCWKDTTVFLQVQWNLELMMPLVSFKILLLRENIKFYHSHTLLFGDLITQLQIYLNLIGVSYWHCCLNLVTINFARRELNSFSKSHDITIIMSPVAA